MKKEEIIENVEEKPICFVIMPISDPDGYEKGHFKCVYEDVFKPAIEDAGYKPFRVDERKSSSLIQVNIIDEIINAPMAICDLSTRNPNVLFELGIRQAFDLPVVLVQEEGTERIFDISTINTLDYHSGLIYRDVIKDRKMITEAIESTRDDVSGINSIIKLLQIGRKAEISDGKMTETDELKLMLMSLTNEVGSIKQRMINKERREKWVDSNYDRLYAYSFNEMLKERENKKEYLRDVAKRINMTDEMLLNDLKENEKKFTNVYDEKKIRKE